MDDAPLLVRQRLRGVPCIFILLLFLRVSADRLAYGGSVERMPPMCGSCKSNLAAGSKQGVPFAPDGELPYSSYSVSVALAKLLPFMHSARPELPARSTTSL